MIVAAVDDLPDTVESSVVEQAEAFLLREAADHDARALRILGRRLLEVLDPGAAEEATARAAASFTMADDGHGKVHGRLVTMTSSPLVGGLAAAGLCDDSRISAGEARRLACTAGLIPVVLGLRDGGCTAVGCDRPPSMTHAHHDHPWPQGGRTEVMSGRLLCARHHTLAHDPRYDTTVRPDHKSSFHLSAEHASSRCMSDCTSAPVAP